MSCWIWSTWKRLGKRVSVPVNLITGFLGVGKTTVIRNLLEQGTLGRVAVLVNEFGDVAIDQAILPGSGDGLAVKEIAGGCICCSAEVGLKAALVEILRRFKPERLLIEPTGLGHPAGVVDILTSADFCEHVNLKPLVCLVDPRRFNDPRLTGSETFRDQILMADVLVAAKADLATDQQLKQFHDWSATLFPAKVAVDEVHNGRLDPGLLDKPVRVRIPIASASVHLHHHSHRQPQPVEVSPEVGKPLRFENRGLGYQGCGWIFSPDERFIQKELEAFFTDKAGPLHSVERLKGLFRVGPGRRILVDQVAGELTVTDWVAYRRDSRVEVILPTAEAIKWDDVEHGLLRCLKR
ncbi:MAG: GTP-binding protein [Magnetococcales bacterium]|nr:GTP-binding protein [Magnetococcales bacterium]